MKRLLTGVGIGLLVLSLVILVAGIWEVLGGARRGVKIIEVPGFQELDLDTPGFYAGIYQHSGNSPLPTESLSKMDIRIVSKDTYQEIPVLLNTSGQTFSRLGLQGMVLFNVLIERPGFYSMTALYKEGVKGPTVPILFIAQSGQTLQLNLMVGAFFFLVFLSLGIFVLFRAKKL